MATEIRVPSLGESISEATVGQWFKQAGDQVTADEPLVELETDKVTVEVPAPASGVLSEIAVSSGATVAIGTLLGSIADDSASVTASKKDPEVLTVAKAVAAEPALRSPAAATARAAALEREPSPREEVERQRHAGIAGRAKASG